MNDSKLIAHQLMAIIMPLTRSVASELRTSEQKLNPSHLGALAMLAERPCNLSELAEYQGVSLPTMSGTITRLETRGWVSRERSTADRRVVLIELTPKGRSRFDQMTQQAETFLITLVDTLNQAERETASSGLAVLQKLFSS